MSKGAEPNGKQADPVAEILSRLIIRHNLSRRGTHPLSLPSSAGAQTRAEDAIPGSCYFTAIGPEHPAAAHSLQPCRRRFNKETFINASSREPSALPSAWADEREGRVNRKP